MSEKSPYFAGSANVPVGLGAKVGKPMSNDGISTTQEKLVRAWGENYSQDPDYVAWEAARVAKGRTVQNALADVEYLWRRVTVCEKCRTRPPLSERARFCDVCFDQSVDFKPSTADDTVASI